MSKIYFLLLILGLGFASCQSTPVNEDLLIGDWKLKEGFRNKKASSMLDGIYFNIKMPNTVTTNFMGSDEEGSFELKKDKLTINTAQKTNFDVLKSTEDQLEIATILRGIPFRFVLEKEK